MIKLNGEEFELNRFLDGTLNIKCDPKLLRENKPIIITWIYENDSEFMAVAFLRKYYERNDNVILFLPYIPNARMDRIKEDNDVFTLKYFAEMINSLNFTSVYVVDPHSDVSTALINNCMIISVDNIFDVVVQMIIDAEKINDVNNFPIVFYPDFGAMRKYCKTDKDLLPYAYGNKNRDWETGKITNYSIVGINSEIIKNRPVIIRDDILSEGTTVCNAVRKLKKLGASNIYLFVTHLENNSKLMYKLKKDLFEFSLITHIFTTDSIYAHESDNKVTVFNLGLKTNE